MEDLRQATALAVLFDWRAAYVGLAVLALTTAALVRLVAPDRIEAARRAGVRTIAFRSGGWKDEDLAGAIAIYDGPWDLLDRLDDSPIAATAVAATKE